MERFNQACSWLAAQAFEMKTANKISLQQHFYYELRERFGLSAQMAAICIRHVGGTYSRDKSIKPTFRKHAAMPYDNRILSFKGVDRVSILTSDGRIIIPFVMGKYQRERFSLVKRQCDLVLRKDGKWFLLAIVDVPEGTPIPTKDFIGIDPCNTSRTCPECGHIDKGNRPVRDLFLCRSCGHFDHADVVGATNIASAAKVA